MDPTEDELTQINTVDDALDWSGVAGQLRDGLLDALGGVNRAREVPLIHRPAWDTAVGTLVMPEDVDPAAMGPPNQRPLTPVEQARIESFRRVCHLRIGRVPDERAVPPQPLGAPFPPLGGGGQPAPATTRRVKLSSILDPTLDADIVAMSNQEQAEAYRQYPQTVTHQLSGLSQVLAAGSVPFCCFTVWGPHGQRLLRKQTFTSYQLNVASGEWSKKELPGPSNYHSWYQSWRVFRTAMLLLQACDAERLDCYAETIRGFVTQFGDEAWFLISKADSQMRSEHLERIRRQMRATPTLGYSENSPWSSCFAMACKDHEYWSREFHTPATLFLARHGTKKEPVKEEQQGGSPPKRQKPTKAARRGYTGTDHSKKDEQGVYTVNRRGIEMCKNYNQDRCGTQQAQGKCKAKRSHQCNLCLGPHQAISCYQGPVPSEDLWLLDAQRWRPKEKTMGADSVLRQKPRGRSSACPVFPGLAGMRSRYGGTSPYRSVVRRRNALRDVFTAARKATRPQSTSNHGAHHGTATSFTHMAEQKQLKESNILIQRTASAAGAQSAAKQPWGIEPSLWMVPAIAKLAEEKADGDTRFDQCRTGLATTKPTRLLSKGLDLNVLQGLRCNHPRQQQTKADGTTYMASHASTVQQWVVNDEGQRERASKSQGQYTSKLSSILAKAFHATQRGASWLKDELAASELP
eukprot:s1434_g18.t1